MNCKLPVARSSTTDSTHHCPLTPVQPFLQFATVLVAMVFLMAFSAFFSASEAALFYLTREDRERLSHGNRSQRRVVRLLAGSERLLTSILFWNLVINIAYFALASRVGLNLEKQGHSREAGLFTLASILAIILCSEMLPKNLAVLWPRRLAAFVSLPLATATRLLDPIIPTLRAVNRISVRTLLPNFQRESYLDLRDIERAITLSTPDKTLARQEELVLHQIVSLTEVTAEELMRPRLELNVYQPPLTLEHLKVDPPKGDYLLVAEPGSEEVAGVMPVEQMADAPQNNIDDHCEQVVYVPWSATGASTLDLLRHSPSGVAVVVNEHGETIGIVTFDDVLHMLFANPALRTAARAASTAIQPIADGDYAGGWSISGTTTLRRLGKHLGLKLPTIKSVTVAGMLQEHLQRLPEVNDQVEWAGCRFRVVESGRPGPMSVELLRLDNVRSIDATQSDESSLASEEGSDL